MSKNGPKYLYIPIKDTDYGIFCGTNANYNDDHGAIR